MRVIESISRSGVVSSTWDHTGAANPRPGDHVKWPDGTYGQVDSVGTGFCNADEVHVCEEQGSVFLLDLGAVSISGGPFCMVKGADLEATYVLRLSRFWN